jgi:hypothetical protein
MNAKIVLIACSLVGGVAVHLGRIGIAFTGLLMALFLAHVAATRARAPAARTASESVAMS